MSKKPAPDRIGRGEGAPAGDTIAEAGGDVQILNQYSFLLAAALGLLVLAFALLRDGVRASDLIALAALALGFTAAFALLRPEASAVDDAEATLAQIGSGTPVLLEFQSPF